LLARVIKAVRICVFILLEADSASPGAFGFESEVRSIKDLKGIVFNVWESVLYLLHEVVETTSQYSL